MTSKYFVPGNNSVRTRVFSSYNNNIYTFKNYFPCNCNNVIKDPLWLDGYPNMSKAQLRANMVINSVGNRSGYTLANGNGIVNYLGRVEGQLGGSGKPLRNSFS